MTSTLNKRIHTIIAIISAILLLFSFLISPFREELDIPIKQIDEDGILVLKLIYFITLIQLCFGFFVLKIKNNTMKITYIGWLVLTFSRILYIFYIG